MRAKQSPSYLVALGLLVGCGPIAFNDSINFEEPKRTATIAATPEPEQESAPAPTRSRATLTADRIEITELIQFEKDSAVILDVSHSLLDEVVTILQENPRVEKLDIVGFTSSEGSKAHNEKLSTDRAAAVKQYLIDHGIDTGRLSSQGKGPADPVASNDTEEGRIANRRVEFHVTKMAGADAKGGGVRAKPGASK